MMPNISLRWGMGHATEVRRAFLGLALAVKAGGLTAPKAALGQGPEL